MYTGVLLSYVGIGANLLHLSYVHEIAKKYGPIELITFSEKIPLILKYDPAFKNISFINKYNKKFIDIFKFSNFLRSKKLDKLYIFYPSVRLKIAGKLAGIPEVKCYPLFKKNKLHLVKAAQNFTKQVLNIDDCKTETKFFLSKEEKEKSSLFIKKEKKNIFIGASSSGPTNQWSIDNFIKLINKIKQKVNSHFFILVGKNEVAISEKIINEIGKQNATSMHDLANDQISSIASCSDFYIGNDTFPHHICCQRSIPSIILLIDTPRAYSDYSKYQHQITPDNISLDDMTHGTRAGPDSIKVEKIFNKFLELLD